MDVALGKITKLCLLNKSSLAEVKQASNQHHQMASKVVFLNIGAAFLALMHIQGQAFGVCLANKVS